MAESMYEIKQPLCVDCDGTLIKTDLLYESLCALVRACRKTPLKETEGLFPCLFPLDGSGFGSSVCPDGFSPHLWARTRSRISLFSLKERIDRGPAISSVCHRCSLGLLNPYLSVFRVPIMPSGLPRSLRTVCRTASATCHARWPLG